MVRHVDLLKAALTSSHVASSKWACLVTIAPAPASQAILQHWLNTDTALHSQPGPQHCPILTSSLRMPSTRATFSAVGMLRGSFSSAEVVMASRTVADDSSTSVRCSGGCDSGEGARGSWQAAALHYLHGLPHPSAVYQAN